jgi:hypothetical protein
VQASPSIKQLNVFHSLPGGVGFFTQLVILVITISRIAAIVFVVFIIKNCCLKIVCECVLLSYVFWINFLAKNASFAVEPFRRNTAQKSCVNLIKKNEEFLEMRGK